MPLYVPIDIPPQNIPMLIAQVDNSVQQSIGKADRVIGICHLAQNPPIPATTAVNVVSAVLEVQDYLMKFEHRGIYGPVSARVVQQPAHGILSDAGGGDFQYVPKEGFLGKDQATILVEMSGMKIGVRYFFQVLDSLPADSDQQKYCPRYKWKISQVINLGSGTDADSFVIDVSNLEGSSVGQTTGTTITLDTNAAGYGWFIDYTPYLNEEYLPTSNPNLWVAKEGSEAAGKMDLLSVLLHEYGHALGIEHSADSGDYMATTLAPGVRRLPSSEELALMARLVAEAKASYDVVAIDEVPQPGAPLDPVQPGAPLPSRNGSGGGNVRTTRARISRFGTTILNADGSFRYVPREGGRL